MRNILILLLLVCTGVYAQDVQNIDADTAKVAKSGYNRISIKTGKLFFRGLTGTKKEVVSTNNSYANPSWIPSLALAKVTGLQDSLSNSVKKIAGKGLSANDYTTEEKNRLSNFNFTDLEKITNTTISAWGDSMTQGSGGTPYTTSLSDSTFYTIYNGGVGGETSTQIKVRMLAATTKYADNIIIWVGRNNYTDTTQIKNDIAAMIAALGHNRYLVLGVTNGNYGGYERVGGEGYNYITRLNTSLGRIYGEKYFDVRKYLVNNRSSSPQDLQDFADDIVPTSLRSDAIHLNTLGYSLVTKGVLEKFHILIGVQNTVVGVKNLVKIFSSPPTIGSRNKPIANLSKLNIGTASGTQTVNIANNNNIGIEGGYVFFTGATAGVLFQGNAGITGSGGVLNLVSGGSNQNINITPSGTGSIIGITPLSSDNSTKLATTAYVKSQGYIPFNSSSSGNILLTGNMFLQGAGNSVYFAGNGSISGNAGNVQILPNLKSVLVNTSTDIASSILTVESTTKGLLPPRMTTTQRDAIVSPAEGLEIYNLTTHTKDFYNGTVWKTITTN